MVESLKGSSALDDQLSSLLLGPQFSIASYLNLSLSDTDGELQQRMAELALQLQIQTQGCHEEIGRIGAELQAILPRCAADVGRVGVGLEGMRIDATSLLESTSIKGQEEVSSSLETLSKLHALQSNLLRTKEVLTAAATWDSTLSSLAPLLAQQNLTEAVNALAQLESGERALRGMPDPEKRHQAIVEIRKKIQTMLQPQLKHALQNMSTRLAPLQHSVSLYLKLGKVNDLMNEYVKNRPTALHKAWFDYVPYGGDVTNPDTTQNLAASFLNWLPGWYDAVLMLITEERQQSSAIFGYELFPEIIVKVLNECFRPILPSFRSRLQSLFSSDVDMPTKGSLESICSAYESTLHFFSLAYEATAGGWLDMIEGGFVKGDGAKLFKDLTNVFLQIATPFTQYQERLAQLESKHSAVATELVSKDIKEVANTVLASDNVLLALQDATGMLTNLSTFVFPLAESSLARFELLNGGYNVVKSLNTIDDLLSGHAKELATAVSSLSMSMTADAQTLTTNYDDQHVLYALEILKTAGTFRQHVHSFKLRMQERLIVLIERIKAHDNLEKSLDAALSGDRKGSASSFPFPESLSVVEVDSFLIKVICEDYNDECNPSIKILERYASLEHKSSVVSMFPKLDEAVKDISNSCHAFVFAVCSAVPYHYLGEVSSMNAWKELAETEDSSYGTLPQQYITHVGEHMLALVQALEPFASDSEALTLVSEVMEGVRNVSLSSWIGLERVVTQESEGVAKILMDGKGISHLVIGGFEEEESEPEDEDEDEADRASAAFCNAWLDVVGLAVTGRLLERIMRIPQLTPKGCEHLLADLNYLINVFSALGLPGHPHPLLIHIAELATLDSASMKEHLSDRDSSKPVEVALQSIEQQLTAMRDVAQH